MSNLVIADKTQLINVADAIREKVGFSGTLSFPDDFTDKLDDIMDAWSIVTGTIHSFSDENITSIGNYAFSNCKWLKNVNIPSVTKLGKSCFASCILKEINLPLVTTIDETASNIFSLNSLETVNMPNLTNTTDNMFSYNSFRHISLPSVTKLGASTFSHCSFLESVDLPLVTEVGAGVFDGCKRLKSITLPNVTSIGSRAFIYCDILNTIILPSNTLCTLSDKNAFSGTPFYTGGTGGIVYVPEALVESYQTATNWSSLACKFIPIEGELQAFKGKMMLRNNECQVNVPYYRPVDNESEPTVTVLSNNTDIVSVSDIVISDKNIAFNVNSHNIDGETTITVTVVFDDRVFTQSSSFRVVEVLPYEYDVESVDGATYGFALNDAGYYESQNKGVNSSCAICKINFTTDGSHSMKLKCINSGERNYDFGILSNVDTTLTLSYTVDSANVFKSFKGLSSTTEQIVDYGVVEAGKHFIYIKYQKDGSGKDGNDSLQFSVEFME